MNKETLSVQEFAIAVGYSEAMVYKAIKLGKIKCLMEEQGLARREVRVIPIGEVEKFRRKK